MVEVKDETVCEAQVAKISEVDELTRPRPWLWRYRSWGSKPELTKPLTPRGSFIRQRHQSVFMVPQHLHSATAPSRRLSAFTTLQHLHDATAPSWRYSTFTVPQHLYNATAPSRPYSALTTPLHLTPQHFLDAITPSQRRSTFKTLRDRMYLQAGSLSRINDSECPSYYLLLMKSKIFWHIKKKN